MMTKLTRSKMLLKLFVVLALFVASTFADNDPNCGTKGPKPSQRIVGGVNAEPLEFPWQGSLRYFSPTAGWYHTCGCSLINKRWVLTASHCVNRSGVVDPTKYRFVGGEHDRSINEGKEVEVGITDIFVSPLWDPDRIDGDASLLKLERDLKLDDEEKHLGTVCIPDVEDLDKHAGKTCIATGWGNTAWQGTSPNILQKVEVKIIDQATCASRYAIVNPISSRMLCFGENMKGTCQGDSGGPLNCNVDGKWYTYGATSFGVQCAGPKYPSVTARISEFSSWIWQTIAKNS